jgi:hypothetical protein
MKPELTDGSGKVAWIGVFIIVRMVGTMEESSGIEWIVVTAESERIIEPLKGLVGDLERAAALDRWISCRRSDHRTDQ